jgi:hypothetical protein
MDDQELALLLSAPVSIRDLFPGTFGYRLRMRRWAASTPSPNPYWRSRQQGENPGGGSCAAGPARGRVSEIRAPVGGQSPQ